MTTTAALVAAATGRDDLANLLIAPHEVVDLPSPLPLGELAAVSVTSACLAADSLAYARANGQPASMEDLTPPRLNADRVTAAFRSEQVFSFEGRPPNAWAPLSGYFETADGWVRTHANYPHHATALLRMLGLPSTAARDQIAAELRTAPSLVWEDHAAIVGAVVTKVRTVDDWHKHPHAVAMRSVPVVRRLTTGTHGRPLPSAPAVLPLTGVRVLDLTRVIAGPVATRTLALYGANVLRIDSPSLPEISWQYLDTGQGKRSALLDLAQPDAAAILDDLLHSADVLVTGYRPGALDRFGLDPASIRSRAPHLITATVDAWGPSGPWSHRRGFDSIVQATSGIASLHSRNDAPGAMPAQALDHSAGYLLAASVMSALERRHLAGDIEHVGISLLSVAHLLIDARSDPPTVQNEPAATKSWQQCTTQLHLPNGESVPCARPAPTLRGQALDYAAYESGYGHARPVWSYA